MTLRDLWKRLTTDPIVREVNPEQLADVHHKASEVTIQATEVERRLGALREGQK